MEEFQAGNVTPPVTAGSLESLVGTTWDLGRGRTLTFGPDGQGSAGLSGGLPMNMRYELEPNGVITVILPAASRSGTWDGTSLIIDGEEAQPLNGSGAPMDIDGGMPSPEALGLNATS